MANFWETIKNKVKSIPVPTINKTPISLSRPTPVIEPEPDLISGISDTLTKVGIPKGKVPYIVKPNNVVKATFGDLAQAPAQFLGKNLIEPAFNFLSSVYELATDKEAPKLKIPVIGKTKFFGKGGMVDASSYQQKYVDAIKAGELTKKDAQDFVYAIDNPSIDSIKESDFTPDVIKQQRKSALMSDADIQKEAYKQTLIGGIVDAVMLAEPIKIGAKFGLEKFAPETLIKKEITTIPKETFYDYFSGRKTATELGIKPEITKKITEKMSLMDTKEKAQFLKGFDLLTAKPSIVGKIFGVSEQEATSILKKSEGELLRPTATASLPGTRETPGQAPAMGLSTRKVETVGKTTSLDEFVKTDDIIDVDSKLINEAKKYNSAEKFVSSKPVVYHGTTAKLKQFNNKQGTYFTDDYMNADGYASGENIYEGYLDFKNPLTIDAKGKKWDNLKTEYGTSTQEIVGKVDSKKYDGIIFKNIKDSWIDDVAAQEPGTIYYAFKPRDSFLNESQLTDIWNKAQGEKEAVKDIKVYRGEGKGIGNSTYVKGEYFADSEEFAKQFGDVTEYTIPSDAKIFNLDDIKNGNVKIPENILVDQDALTKYIIDKGFEYTKNTNTRGIEYVKLNKTANDLQNLANTSNSLSDFKKRVMDNYDQYREELARLSKNYTNADISRLRDPMEDIWNKAQGISKNEVDPGLELTDNEKVIQEKISKQDFENIVERFWPKVKEWYSDAEVGVDDQPIYTFKEYLEKVDGRTIELELDSDYVSNRAIHDILGDEEIYISEVVDMYKAGTLRDTISREAYKVDLAKPSKTIPEKGKRLFYEKEKSYTGDIKELFAKANTKVTPANKLSIMEARRKLYLEWATNPNLAEELGISQSILNKKIKTISGTNVEASQIQQRVNEGIPEQYQWTGISNSNFLVKTKVTLKDVDKVVNKIDDKTAKLGTYAGKELRNYIMNTFLSIDTRLRYDDLNFDIQSLERALGQYSNKDLTITIAQQSQHTVAHEIGHYLDYRWAREMGVDSSLADANYSWNYIQEKYKLPDEQIAWAKEYIKFVKNLSQKSEIGYSAKRAEYLQSPTEIFARFIDRFVDWTASKSGYHYSETNYYSDKFAVSDFYDFIKLLQKKAEIDTIFKIKPKIAKGTGVVNKNEVPSIEGIKDQISFMEEVLSNHPGKELIKYVSKSTGRLPEITGKKTMQAISGSGKIVKTSEFGVKGDDILQSIAGYGKDGDEIIEEYRRMKDNLNALKEDLKEIRTQESLDRISKKLADEQEKLIQFSKQYPELARFTLKLTEQETRGAIKGYKLGLEVASRTIKKDVMDTVKAAYDKKIARIKDSKEILQNRRTLIKAVQKQFGIGDDDLKAITRRDIRLMSNYEFKQFLDDIRAKSEEFMVRRQAQNELIAQINEKELNIEPLREAMKFPPISEMSTEQLRNFDAILEKYKQGDVFLSKRKLETIERTELKDIKTYREAREILAKKIGVKPEELNNIKISEFDRFKSFSSLAETNPFFKMVVEETTKLRLQADAEYLAIEKQANKLAKKVKTTFMQKLIPQQKNIRAWFEAKDKSTVRLTKEESDLVNFMMKEWGKARDELVIKQVMDRGIQTMNYFTHIRRGILEAVKEDGVIQAAKEVFDQYKMDEQNFNILDTETGEVLAMDKFFRFALKRTGGLKPTENIVGAFLNYMKMYKRKQALDEIVPLIDTYAHALTPKGTTEKGLLLHGDMIRFMKEWLNTQKGRRITLLSKEGGKIDWALKSIKSFTTLLDIGLNIPVSVATQIGEQAIQYQLLGKGKFLKAKYRALTRRGRRITSKYRNLIGKNPWTQLVEPMRSIGDRLNEGIFTLFQDANVRRNKNVMLGLMTKEEWASETITPERLAQLKIATGRYGVVDGIGSIVGATPESKIVTQYKTWAIPIMTSQVKNLTYMAKYLGTLGKANKKEAARAMAETWRMLELGAFVAIVAGAFVDKEDDSFLGKLKLRAIQEANTLFGAAPAMTTVPRMIGFLTDLAKNTISLLKLEEYKASKFGEYKIGDLRGLQALEKMFTPRAIKQFQTPPIKTIDDVKKEIKEDIESGALSISAAKEKYISELNKLKTADKKARFKLKQDEYKKDLAERIKNKEITISEAKEEYIDYVEANVDLFSSKDGGSFIDKVLLYAKAFGTDPVTASIYLFQGEKIRRVDNGAIIVERMTVEESQGIKKERGATSDMILDHIIPLQLGGSNSKNNLKLVDTDEWSSYTPVENYIGDKLRAGMIDKKEAQRLIKEFKDGKITKEQIMK